MFKLMELLGLFIIIKSCSDRQLDSTRSSGRTLKKVGIDLDVVSYMNITLGKKQLLTSMKG